MLSFIVRRLIVALLVCLAVSAVSFGLMFVTGDPAIALAGEGARAQDAELVRKAMGFDRPLAVQYIAWIFKVLQGDFGRSFYFDIPVARIIGERIPVTLVLGFTSFAVALVCGMTLGVAAALRPNSLLDRAALITAVFGQAVPSFWLGLVLIVIFGVWADLAPTSGADDWRGFILPVIVLSYSAMPAIMRITRAGMIEVMRADYVRTARAKGLLPLQVIVGHALRNAVLPVVALAAVQLGVLLSGSIVVESVFALNGLGRLAWESLLRSDLPVVQSIILILSVIYVLLTTIADLINAWLDPRIRGM